MTSVKKFARRLEQVEKGLVATQVQPRLPYSSIDGGALRVLDPVTGQTQATIGTQWDGTVTSTSQGGTTPVPPTVPLAVPMPGGLALYWDGTYVDGSPTRMDFKRITFHAVTDVDDLDILSPTQICGEITIATGGEVFATLPPVEQFIFAVTWTDAGKFSVESDVAFATPLEVVSADLWQEHEDALTELNDVTLPALTTDLANLDTRMDDAEGFIDTLNDVTLPGLVNDLEAAETALIERTRLVYAPAQPTGLGANDRVLWFDTDGGFAPSYWNGTAWGPYALGPESLAANSVIAGKIAADAVTTSKLAADAVTAAKIAAHTITALQIAADTITANEIAASAITATEIAADAVVAGKIAVDAISARELQVDCVTTNKIAAAAVTANELDVEVLRAGFTLTGRVQVGSSYWTPAEGLVIPQPNGGRIQLPADGVTPARFDGHVNAKSLTVENNLNVMGAANKVNGQVTLASGITEPTVAPSMYQSWPSVYSEPVDGSGTSWRIYQGMAPHHSNAGLFVAAVQFGGAGIRLVDKATGALAAFPDPTAGKAWITDFYPGGGLGYANSHYFIYGQDATRGMSWYIYKINSSFDKVAETFVGTSSAHSSGTPALTCDTSNNVVYLFWNEGTLGKYAKWDTNLNLTLASTTFNDYGVAVGHEAAWVGAGDFGVSKILLAIDVTKSVVAFNVSGMVFDSSQSFPYPEASPLRGIYYDTANSRFKSYDRTGKIFTLSSWKSSQSFTGSYTWYDGAGTVRETREGPTTTFTLPARAHLNVETSVPPDSGNTDAAQVDKANRTGIYVGVGAGGRKHQSYLGVDGSGVSIRKLTLDTVATGTASPPASNTFVGGTTSTGKIVSGATGAGQPLLEVSGDGSMKAAVGTITTATVTTLNGQTIADTGWTALPFGSGFSNFGSGFESCQYRRRNGVVFIRGLANSGARTAGSIIGTLPPGFCPGGTSHIAVPSNGAFAIINIFANGQIQFNSGATSGWLSLSNISFIAEN